MVKDIWLPEYARAKKAEGKEEVSQQQASKKEEAVTPSSGSSLVKTFLAAWWCILMAFACTLIIAGAYMRWFSSESLSLSEVKACQKYKHDQQTFNDAQNHKFDAW